jgi:hypothetical protein
LVDSSVHWAPSRYSTPLSGDTCSGSGGYADFGPGMDVVVKNEKGEVIGTASTVQGPLPTYVGADWEYACEVDFTVPVPAAKFYSMEVGHRGATTESFDQLVGMQWHVLLKLGY